MRQQGPSRERDMSSVAEKCNWETPGQGSSTGVRGQARVLEWGILPQEGKRAGISTAWKYIPDPKQTGR